MLKKIVITALIVWGVTVFYQNFLKSILVPFFNKNKGQVDLFQKSTSLEK
ncbi:MAG: hypothetical protein K9L87_03380 [Candidatus Omnitrophica bacterium]|nr:hypothetical protein [Candidatus Omnitrophota bacterium]MCF7892119.1 hypothetical protein [Candidatus Omnitrophota bacterium]MCF7896162.1 hypothetical protein [Candidatus Omnitrophota bacterium]MCF7897773.1 hypothetical protein [Candidatus Omnitrophota bacterium]MCF7909201.1 hypothetical protein [Candidatus Omnitrophota bacterium]